VKPEVVVVGDRLQPGAEVVQQHEPPPLIAATPAPTPTTDARNPHAVDPVRGLRDVDREVE
jgi:hypothetical protein